MVASCNEQTVKGWRDVTVGAHESIGNGRLGRRKGGEGAEKRGMDREAQRRGERKINKVIKHELRAEMTS